MCSLCGGYYAGCCRAYQEENYFLHSRSKNYISVNHCFVSEWQISLEEEKVQLIKTSSTKRLLFLPMMMFKLYFFKFSLFFQVHVIFTTSMKAFPILPALLSSCELPQGIDLGYLIQCFQETLVQRSQVPVHKPWGLVEGIKLEPVSLFTGHFSSIIKFSLIS